MPVTCVSLSVAAMVDEVDTVHVVHINGLPYTVLHKDKSTFPTRFRSVL